MKFLFTSLMQQESYPWKTTDSSSFVVLSLLLGVLHLCQGVSPAFLAQWAYFLALFDFSCLQKNQPFQNGLVSKSLSVLQIGWCFQLPSPCLHFQYSLPKPSTSMPQLVENMLLYWRGVLLHWCVSFALWPHHPLGVRPL